MKDSRVTYVVQVGVEHESREKGSSIGCGDCWNFEDVHCGVSVRLLLFYTDFTKI